MWTWSANSTIRKIVSSLLRWKKRNWNLYLPFGNTPAENWTDFSHLNFSHFRGAHIYWMKTVEGLSSIHPVQMALTIMNMWLQTGYRFNFLRKIYVEIFHVVFVVVAVALVVIVKSCGIVFLPVYFFFLSPRFCMSRGTRKFIGFCSCFCTLYGVSSMHSHCVRCTVYGMRCSNQICMINIKIATWK